MNLVRAITTVGGLTGLSRIAGFARDVLTASILGVGGIADAFFVALKLPNFFRRVTAEGAFSVCFVPVLTEIQTREGRTAAYDFASNMFMVMLAALSVFCLLAMLAMPLMITVIAPGFETHSSRFDLSVELARMTFPYLLAMSLTALLGGLLNAQGRFGPFAVAPVLFNLSLIGALVLAQHFETPGHALAWGVALAGVLQLGWLLIAARGSQFRLHIKWPSLSPDVKKVLKLMGPGVVGAGVMHINLFADLIIASFLGTGAISSLYYADRLNQLPLGVIGIAIGTALLPMLSQAFSDNSVQRASRLFHQSLHYGLAFALPAAVGLALLAPLIISTLFERGAFSAQDSLNTAEILRYYTIGLPAYVALKVFSTVHWAQKDTLTPVKIAAVSTAVNIALSLLLVQVMGVAGLALGTSLAGWLQIALHARALNSLSLNALSLTTAFPSLVRIVLATAFMSAGTYAVFILLPAAAAHPALRLALCIGAGGSIYGLCALGLGLIKKTD